MSGILQALNKYLENPIGNAKKSKIQIKSVAKKSNVIRKTKKQYNYCHEKPSEKKVKKRVWSSPPEIAPTA